MTDAQLVTHLDFALHYVREYGWRVFPVHGVEYDQSGTLVCTCGRGDGCPENNRGKHPATPQGFKDAVGSSDGSWEAKVRAWWTARPSANIGVATGRMSGVFVVDVDVKNGDGPAALARWWSENGEKPWVGTLAERSGSGGQHYFFAYPSEGEVPSRNGWLDSVDVKSDGGYVVVAPSRIPRGKYDWTTTGVAPQPASSSLLAAVRSGSGRDTGGVGFQASVEEKEFLNGKVPEGQRNDLFFHFATRWLWKTGGDVDMVAGMLQSVWERMPNRDGFEADEVVKILRSALDRYRTKQAEDVVSEEWIRSYTQNQNGNDAAPPPTPFDVSEVYGGLGTAPDGFALTDGGNAKRLYARYGSEIRHTTGIGWLVWDGARWNSEDADKQLQSYAKSTVGALLTELVPALSERNVEDAVVRRVFSWWRQSDMAGRYSAMTRLTTDLASRRYGDWDQDDWLLNCVNGTVDLRTGEFRPHERYDFITRLSGARWEEGAGCLRWERFMAQMVPDGEVRRYLQKAVGYSLTGSVDEKCFFILHGPGNNGKTMFTQTIGMLMGEYWNAAPKSVFIGYNTKNDQHPTDLAGVAGARYVTSAEEVTKQDHLAEARIKSMTGGNTMKARFMHQDFFEFDFKGKLWLDTNYRPRLSDFSDALQERIRLIPWEVVVPEGERRGRSEMMAEFAGELSGILRWAVEGCLMWREEGLVQPEAVREATREYVHDENLVAQFFDDCVTVGGFTPTGTLVTVYKMWLMQQGHDLRYALSPQTLGKEMVQLGCTAGRGTKGERGWCVTLSQESTGWV